MAESGKLKRIELSGYKSIRNLDLELTPLNILIGPNGAGKSNFISFFRFMSEILERGLQLHVSTKGTAEAFLHFGSRVTTRIKVHLCFDTNGYEVELIPTEDGRLVFKSESLEFPNKDVCGEDFEHQETGTKQGDLESNLEKLQSPAACCVRKHIGDWKIYHFHDTSDTALVKKTHSIHDNISLRPQGENLAAFLYSIRDTSEYGMIVRAVRRVVPLFHDFSLLPDKNNEDQIRLRWKHKRSTAYFDANSLSDGTLRFMCLATLLMQPDLPNVILLDEPELGIHPYALEILAGILKTASRRSQVIVSTQSVTLANKFDWQDIIIVDQTEDGESHFRRLEEENVKLWLDDYSIGDLWEKDLLGGNPE